jgi:hypothetical protein
VDKEEFLVAVHSETGRVLGFHHSLPEDRPGAALDDAAARGLAAGFAAAQGWDLAGMELKETHAEQKKARRDHQLVWEAGAGDPRNLDEAHYRIDMEVAGDAVTALRTHWKIPETFARLRSEQNAISIAVSLGKIGVISMAVVIGLLMLVQGTRQGTVRWGAAMRMAIPFTLLAALDAALTYHLGWRNYDTALPVETFQTMMITSLLTSLAFAFLYLCAIWAFLQIARPARWTAPSVDAALAALLAIGLAALVSQLQVLLMDRFHAYALFSAGAPDLIASAVPALSALARGARSALLWCAGLALAAAAIHRLRRRPLLVLAGMALLIASVPGDARTAGEVALHCATGALPLAAVALFWYFARGYDWAYVLAAWGLAVGGSIVTLWPSMQGWIVAVALAGTLAWASVRIFPDTSH